MVQILNFGLPGGDSSINMEIIQKKKSIEIKKGDRTTLLAPVAMHLILNF